MRLPSRRAARRARRVPALAVAALLAACGEVAPGPGFEHYAAEPTAVRLVEVLDGKPDAERGEIVVAFVVLHPDFEPSADLVRELQGHTRRRLSAHAYPREVEFVDELRDFHDRHRGGEEADDFPVPASPDPLTEQERTICKLIAAGATHKRVAGLLDVSMRTVEGRLRAARIRLGLKSN